MKNWFVVQPTVICLPTAGGSQLCQLDEGKNVREVEPLGEHTTAPTFPYHIRTHADSKLRVTRKHIL